MTTCWIYRVFRPWGFDPWTSQLGEAISVRVAHAPASRCRLYHIALKMSMRQIQLIKLSPLHVCLSASDIGLLLLADDNGHLFP